MVRGDDVRDDDFKCPDCGVPRPTYSCQCKECFSCKSVIGPETRAALAMAVIRSGVECAIALRQWADKNAPPIRSDKF